MISAVLNVIADIVIDGLDKGVPGAEKEDFANHGERIWRRYWGRGVRYLLQCFCSRRATTKTVAFGVFLIVAQSAKA